MDSDTFKLEAVNVCVSVLAGTFSCYRVSMAQSSVSVNSYWASGVGIVRLGDASDTERWELKSFNVQ